MYTTNYESKYLKYKSKYYKLLEQIAGNKNIKSLEQIEKDVKICLVSAKTESAIKKCIEDSGKEFILSKINSNNELKCHVIKGTKNYQIISKDLAKNACALVPSSSDPIFNWSNYKNFFPDNIKKTVYAFRTELVDGLINFILSNYPECNQNNIKCTFAPSGSTGPEATLSSDYDLTLAGNYKISVIIQMFNSIFENEFGLTSAEVFDTNLYGYSFLIKKGAIGTNKLWSPIIVSQPIEFQGLITGEIKSPKQDMWAYLRIKTFYEDTTALEMRQVLKSVTHGIYDKYFQSKNITHNGMTAKQKQDEYVVEMRKFEEQMSNSTINTDAAKQTMIDTLSNMNYFGDETYFTQGAFVHVVGLMYFKNETENNKKALFSKKYYLIHSMAENLAYFIHAFYEHKNDIVYAIKYFNRFINALYWLEKTEALANLNIFTDWIKSKIRNRSESEVRKYITDNNQEASKYIPRSDISFNVILENIESKIKNDTASFVQAYTSINISTEPVSKFYLIALLEILKKTIELNRKSTDLQITKTNNQFSISI